MNGASRPCRHQDTSTRWLRGILNEILLVAFPASLPLGMTILAMGAWFVIQRGSIIYLPTGLVILLAGPPPVPEASSRAGVTPGCTTASKMATHLQWKDS